MAVGDEAPDFELKDQHGQTVRLSHLRRHKAALLVFYPWAFTRVCGSEMAALQERLDELSTDDVELLTISTDSMPALRAWSDRDGLTFSMLSDFWPHGEVARAYGVFNEDLGVAMRGTFLVDRDGAVRWSVVAGIPETRNIDDYVKAIAAL